MKILKISLISLVVLVVVLLVAAVIFVKTFDVNRFKPQIISQVSKALSRQVDFQRADLGISLRQGISLKINNLIIADDPVFGKGDFLVVKDISLGVDLLGYIFQKKVNVSGVLIDSPRITIIRQKDGTFNVQSLTKAAGIGKEGTVPGPAPTPLAIPAILISSVKGINGTVSFIDRYFEPALVIDISDLNFSLSRISLTEPFPFVVEAAVLSAKKNIRIEGKAQVNLKTNEVTISELKGETDLADILLEKIPVSFPMAKGASLPVGIKGKVEALLNNLTAGPKGLTALDADASLMNGTLQFKELASPIKDVGMNIKITEKKIIMDKTTAAIGEGMISGSGSIDDYLAGQDYSIEAIAQDIKIQDLITQDKSPVKAEGLASAQIRFTGHGFSPQALRSTLSGEAEISVTKAKLKDINVLRTVLDKISVIPGLAQKFEAGLPERYKQKLTQQDTALSDIKLPLTIENSRILIKETVLGADEFSFKGKGQAGFDGAYLLEGSFLIPQELSAAMIAQVSQLQYLLNNEKQIYIPLKISGKAGEPKFSVDTEYIAKKLLVDQAKKQLFKVLDKAIGTKEPDATEQSPQDTTQKSPPQDDSSEKPTLDEAVGSILDTIFQ